MIKGIKHIIFDLGNVLLNINPELSIKAFEQLGIPDFQIFYQKLLNRKIFERLETNEISTQDFFNFFKQESGILLEENEIIDAWNALLLDFPLRRLQILQQLQLYYDLILLSNTNEIHEKCFNEKLQLAHGIPSLGVFFDKVYLSHRVGIRKPNLAIYQLVLDDCSFNPEATLFIDDVEENIIAASKLGIQTIWLQQGMSIEKDIFLPMENNLKS